MLRYLEGLFTYLTLFMLVMVSQHSINHKIEFRRQTHEVIENNIYVKNR